LFIDGQVRTIAAERKIGNAPADTDQGARCGARRDDQIRIRQHFLNPRALANRAPFRQCRSDQDVNEFVGA
jgi:hypothetical protein